jgi:hypothetical protein
MQVTYGVTILAGFKLSGVSHVCGCGVSGWVIDDVITENYSRSYAQGWGFPIQGFPRESW